MIIKEYAKYLQKHYDDLMNGKTTATKLLCEWLRKIIHKIPKTHVEKIIHCEIMLAENNKGDFLLVGKSESGRTLMNALNNFAMSYENYIMSRWLEDKKPHHFTNRPEEQN